jgi:hypothetical protein
MSSAEELLLASRSPVRGLPHRKTNFMEQFQLNHVRAIAAAAGYLSGGFSIDDGIDLLYYHKADCAVDKAGMNLGS